MLLSALRLPRILRCTTISRRPRSAALLVGCTFGSSTNSNRSSAAPSSFVEDGLLLSSSEYRTEAGRLDVVCVDRDVVCVDRDVVCVDRDVVCVDRDGRWCWS